MAEPPRPEPVHNSTGAQARWWKPAALGVLCALAGRVAGWFGHSAWTDRQMREDRTIASGALPMQRPTLPLEPLPAPEPEATPAPTERPPQVGEAFVERFDGSMDARWSVLDGWSNGEGMTNDWGRSPVETAPGLLALKLQPGPESSAHKLASGDLQSHARHRDGYFEVQLKVPHGTGLVNGFFSCAGQEGGMRPNEIDIEIFGRNTRVAELTNHENGKAGSKKVTLPFDAADESHVYGFDWQPGHVRW